LSSGELILNDLSTVFLDEFLNFLMRELGEILIKSEESKEKREKLKKKQRLIR
jgi:hypothetical protein